MQEPVTLLKKGPLQRRFPVIFVKFLRTPILFNICERQLLKLDLDIVKLRFKYKWSKFPRGPIRSK